MSLETLKAQQTQIVLQRSQAKDMVEQTERALGQVGAAIAALEEDAEQRAKEAEEKKSAKKRK